MGDKTWKAVERKVAALFGGIRTPLSGSNSKHDTQGDVIRGDSKRAKDPDPPHLCLFPKWLYVETKRNKAVQLLYRVWDRERKKDKVTRPGYILDVFHPDHEMGVSDYVFFALEDFLDSPPYDYGCGPWHGVHSLRKNSAIMNLFKDTEKKASAEKRRVPVVAQKIHNRKGTFVFMRNDRGVEQVIALAKRVQTKKRKSEGVG